MNKINGSATGDLSEVKKLDRSELEELVRRRFEELRQERARSGNSKSS